MFLIFFLTINASQPSKTAVFPSQVRPLLNTYLFPKTDGDIPQKGVQCNTSMPWAYTAAKGNDGSAWIFLYKQTLSNINYLKDKLYYNKLGEILCKRMGLLYLGSDSGVFQRKETLEMLMSVFSPLVKKDLLKTIEFDRHYHHAGRKELLRTKNGLKYRSGSDVGNGQGLQYIGNGKNLENVRKLIKQFDAAKVGSGVKNPESVSIPPTVAAPPVAVPPVEPKYLIAPNYIVHIPIVASEKGQGVVK